MVNKNNDTEGSMNATYTKRTPVAISTQRYERVHGRRPRLTASLYAMWAFEADGAETIFVSGRYADAVIRAKQVARERGIATLYLGA